MKKQERSQVIYGAVVLITVRKDEIKFWILLLVVSYNLRGKKQLSMQYESTISGHSRQNYRVKAFKNWSIISITIASRSQNFYTYRYIFTESPIISNLTNSFNDHMPSLQVYPIPLYILKSNIHRIPFPMTSICPQQSSMSSQTSSLYLYSTPLFSSHSISHQSSINQLNTLYRTEFSRYKEEKRLRTEEKMLKLDFIIRNTKQLNNILEGSFQNKGISPPKCHISQ